MKKIKNYYNNLNLKNKLRFYYIVLVVIPVCLLSVIFYQLASKNILDIASKNVLDVTEKNVELVDQTMQEIAENTSRLNREDVIYTVLDNLGNISKGDFTEINKSINRVLYKYFFDKDIVAAYIKTPDYTLGEAFMVVIPNEKFYESTIFHQADAADGEGIWIATYDPQKEYGVDYKLETKEIITYACKLKPYKIDGKEAGRIKTLKEDTNAILLIYLKTAAVKQIFEENSITEDAQYCVYTQDGHIIAHTDEKKEGTYEEFPWIEYIKGHKSGTLILTYQGERVLVSYAVSAVTGWVSTSVIPIKSLLGEVSDLSVITAVIGMFLLGLLMISTKVISERITSPIGKLTESMRHTGEGEFGEEIPVEGKDEMQYLIAQYNHMSRKIQILIEENYKSELRNKESEIMALNLQLNPHFLNNTLNIINLRVLADGNLDASKMIRALSDMLQYTFRNRQEMVRLEEELDWMKNYIFLMQNRFVGKFEVIYAVDKAAYPCMIPKLLLQPFIENAIIHGFQKITHGGFLQISGKVNEQVLLLEIIDNGKGMSQEEIEKALSEENHRVGLHNAIKRIQLIYDKNGSMEIESALEEGCRICVKIPVR